MITYINGKLEVYDNYAVFYEKLTICNAIKK